MAGRGISITVRLLGPGGGISSSSNDNSSSSSSSRSTSSSSASSNVNNSHDDVMKTFHLPVALHTPLGILKQQMQHDTGIKIADQVVILLDLNDPERNNDRLLFNMDNISLKNCGIRNNSVLTLHALGIQAESLISFEKRVNATIAVDEKVITLDTPIHPRDADHSFNGVVFDIESKDAKQVTVTSLSVGGMLGRVRIYHRDRQWEANKPAERISHIHHWAPSGKLSPRGWTLIADVKCKSSWNEMHEITFNQPVVILPHRRLGFYCHSDLPDDLGIQYQSQRKTSITAANDDIVIYPGLGHTGHVPFDEDSSGWFRDDRTLAGRVSYNCHYKGWTFHEHKIFPIEFKMSVLCLLLCHHVDQEPHLQLLPRSHKLLRPDKCRIRDIGKDMILLIFEYCHWDWFAECKYLYEDVDGRMICNDDFDDDDDNDDNDDDYSNNEEDDDYVDDDEDDDDDEGGNANNNPIAIQNILQFMRNYNNFAAQYVQRNDYVEEDDDDEDDDDDDTMDQYE